MDRDHRRPLPGSLAGFGLIYVQKQRPFGWTRLADLSGAELHVADDLYLEQGILEKCGGMGWQNCQNRQSQQPAKNLYFFGYNHDFHNYYAAILPFGNSQHLK